MTPQDVTSDGRLHTTSVVVARMLAVNPAAAVR